MNLDKLTLKMQEALREAQHIASEKNHQALNPAHVLCALLGKADGVTRPILEKIGVSVDILRGKLEQALDSQPSVTGAGAGQVYLGDELNAALKAADKKRTELKDDYLSVEHFLLGLLASKTVAADLLKEAGVTEKIHWLVPRTWDKGKSNRPQHRHHAEKLG